MAAWCLRPHLTVPKESRAMEQKSFQLEFFREGDLFATEPFHGFQSAAEHFAVRKGRHNGANFVRLVEDGLEVWSERLDA